VGQANALGVGQKLEAEGQKKKQGPGSNRLTFPANWTLAITGVEFSRKAATGRHICRTGNYE